MASFSQPPFFSSLVPIKKTNTLAFSSQPTKFLTFKNSKISSSSAESSPYSQENSPETQPQEEDPVKLAFAKAKAYKSSTQSSNPAPRIVENPLLEPYARVNGSDGDGSISDELQDGDVSKEVPLAVKLALEKAKEYKKSKSLVESEEAVPEIVQSSGVESAEMEENDGLKADEVKDDGGQKEVPLAVKLSLEKAKEYRKNKGVVGGEDEGSETLTSGFNRVNERSPGDKQSIRDDGKKEDFSISSIDFVGLGFSDKKSGRSLPAGLVPISDPFPEGELPEVEILVGDTSKFGAAASKPIPVEEDNAELYKPKVSTWGVFPRPSDISRTYGGGRTIRPGEALETADERAAKEARTRQLLAAYKSKIGLKIDPKLKSECEKALKDGDSLMDLGELEEALPFYEKVMEKLAFQSELHGLAALQWSICQDSLSRPNEARMMYEKLQSHPSPQVSKKARQFFFSFQAMEMMKVTSSTRSSLNTGYQNYFEAFLQEKTNYSLKEDQVDEGGLSQALPYVVFLVSPVVIVLLIAASRFQ
ncbi:uncharacterized protein LOC105169554 [Sesamum indicum]|uniref:Uncharacterized protein LOC105169554 n=1 Tax=Sesamum indicum TaxID=4182 RepID=A0A6I9TTR3_SESIN|nr:uncharacterized protein LOC105169554 [Sesamum indicum]